MQPGQATSTYYRAYIFVPSFDLLIGREGNIFFYNREAVREFLSILLLLYHVYRLIINQH